MSRAAATTGEGSRRRAPDGTCDRADAVRGPCVRVAVVGIVALHFFAAPPGRAPFAAAPGTPGDGTGVVILGPLDEPAAIAVGPEGTLLVAEEGASRVSVFDAKGRLLERWGRPGAKDGELRRPRGIAVAPDGRVYVADTGNHRIEVFSPHGTFEKAWGGLGAAPGQLHEPLGVAVDARRVYVADARNNRVQIFDRDGRFELYVWSYGTRDGQLDRPVDVAVGADGAFYVSDQGNSRIQKFDPEGRFLAAHGGWGPHPGLLAEPGGIAVRDGRLVVADTHNHRVQSFSAAGAVEGVWGEAALGTTRAGGRTVAPADVAWLPAGDGIAVCDPVEDVCRIVDRGAAPPRTVAAAPMTSTSRAASLSGSTLVVAAGGAGMLALDVGGARPSVVGVFGGHGRDALQFVRAAGVAIDARRDAVLVSDAGNYRLAWLELRRGPGESARIDPARTRFARSIFFGDEEALVLGPIAWTLSPALLEPGAIARDARGVTYVADTLFDRIVVLDAGFRPLAAWGSHGDRDGAFLDPVDLALSPSGDVLYALDAGTGRIQAFDRAGKRLFGWGRIGAGRDALVRPVSLAVSGDGTVLVADRAGRIVRYTRHGARLGAWGRPGPGPGALDRPEKVLSDRSGRVFVLDAGGRRLQAFARDGRFLWDLDVIASAAEVRRAGTGSIAKAATAGTASSAATTVPADAAREAARAGHPDACPRRATSSAGTYTVCWTASVDPLPHNAPFALDVTVYEAARPAAPAQLVTLTVDASMPEHGHGLAQQPLVSAIGFSVPRERLPDHALAHGAAVGNGRFEVQDLRLHMPGRWEIAFDIGRGAVIERAQVEILLD